MMALLLSRYSFMVRIHDIDAAGVMFFARFFYHIHDAYEDFLNTHLLSIRHLLDNDILLPICHAEADFNAPIVLNECITIELFLHTLDEQIFIINYQFIDSSGKIKATALTHHVCLDGKSRQRVVLPDSIALLFNR